MSNYSVEIFLSIFVALVIVVIVLPLLVKVAYAKRIVDNPNARRLNKEPIPVLGGVGVFFGITLSLALCCSIFRIQIPEVIFPAVLMLVFTGVIDDIFPIPARNKLLVQVLAVAFLVFSGHMLLDNFDGLWGIYELSPWISYPLTFVALVGIINGFNLIDGVDGLASLYSIVTALICGVIFWIAGDSFFVVLSFSILGALLPFFLQNVFGRKYKMFLGDGGSLMLGMFFAVIISQIVDKGMGEHIKGVVSFVLAIFSIPIFDTLRVMLVRIIKGKSPFSPDKTHMHHLFVSMGYGHIGTTLRIIAMNLVPVVVWGVTEKIPAVSIDCQFYIILSLCITLNIGIYLGVNRWRNNNQVECEALRVRNVARAENFTIKMKPLQKLLDKM